MAMSESMKLMEGSDLLSCNRSPSCRTLATHRHRHRHRHRHTQTHTYRHRHTGTGTGTGTGTDTNTHILVRNENIFRVHEAYEYIRLL